MLVSKQWLSEFVKLPPDSQEIAKRLTLSTVEVEGVREFGAELENIVVGRVEKVEKHPNADKLKVCRVDVGGKELLIVCGGSNVREGMMTAVAKIGAKVRWHGQGNLVELKPAEIRGVKSAGMICGADEIGLSEMFPKKDEREIVDLSGINVRVGAPLAKALGLSDVIFEIDHKSLSHRPDLWGHYGMARELAAVYKKPLAPYASPNIKKGSGVSFSVRVEDTAMCPRYMAVAISGVRVAPSPAWMRERLWAVGVRPINNIVDITNFVMMESGQPLHAFDAEHLHGKIVVRRAIGGEKIKTLDGKEYQLKKDMLVIASAKKPMAIAGIMGGEESGVTEKTTTIVFESANFDPVSVRKTSTALTLRSESSARFEKGQDPFATDNALRRAVELTLSLVHGSRVASPVVDVFGKKPSKRTIRLSWEAVSRSLGMAVEKKQASALLRRLGFGVGAILTVPSWRHKDIDSAVDVMEEILRMTGFERVRPALPALSIAPPKANEERALESKIKELLAYEAGYTEVSLYSFVSPEFLRRLGMRTEDCLELDNPVAKDRPLLRASMIPNLAESAEQNLHRFDGVRLFEIGRVYDGVGKETREKTKIGLVYAGKHTTPFYPLASAIRQLCVRLGIAIHFVKESESADWMHPGRSAQLLAGERGIGKIFELHPIVAQRLGIDTRAAFAELDLASLLAASNPTRSYVTIPPYPAVMRDISFVLDKSATHDDIVKTMRNATPLMVSIELFDVFDGGQIPTGKKSMAFHVAYQSSDKTLAASEADAAHRAVEETIHNRFNAEVRHS